MQDLPYHSLAFAGQVTQDPQVMDSDKVAVNPQEKPLKDVPAAWHHPDLQYHYHITPFSHHVCTSALSYMHVN